MNLRTDSKTLPSSFLMLGTIASTQLGAILAKQLFDGLGQAGALSLSYGFAALVLLLWRRPKFHRYPHRVKDIAIAMGLVLAMMTLCLYGAIARIPLGIATAIQFAGPLTLSAVRSCQRLDLEIAMLTEIEAHDFAHHWVQAWNSHDLDTILSHYAANVILVSPVAAKLLDNPSGKVVSMEVLRAYFTRVLESYSELLIKAF